MMMNVYDVKVGEGRKKKTKVGKIKSILLLLEIVYQQCLSW